MHLGCEHLVGTPGEYQSGDRKELLVKIVCNQPQERLRFSLWIITQICVRMPWLLHKQKAEWLYLFLNYSCVCEQFFCNRIVQPKRVQPDHQKKSMEGNSFIIMQRSSCCCLFI